MIMYDWFAWKLDMILMEMGDFSMETHEYGNDHQLID